MGNCSISHAYHKRKGSTIKRWRRAAITSQFQPICPHPLSLLRQDLSLFQSSYLFVQL
jgi:hypothetical protein